MKENNSNKKKILISGCSHKGIINIQNWFNPDVLIGGFHFMKLSVETKDVEELKTYSKILNDTKSITFDIAVFFTYKNRSDIVVENIFQLSLFIFSLTFFEKIRTTFGMNIIDLRQQLQNPRNIIFFCFLILLLRILK